MVRHLTAVLFKFLRPGSVVDYFAGDPDLFIF